MDNLSRTIPKGKTVLLALGTILVLVLVFRTFHFDFGELRNVNLFYFSLATLCVFTFPLLGTTRWWYILRGLRVEVPLRRVFDLTFGTWALAILPGRIGNFLRVAGISDRAPTNILLSSVLLENVKDVVVLLLIGLIGMIFIKKWTIATLLVLAIICIVLSLLIPKYLLRLWPTLGMKIKVLDDTLMLLLKSKSDFALAALSSVLNWGIYMVHTYFLFLAVGASIPFSQVLAWMPLAMFVGLIPVTLGGMGTRDAAMVYFFGHIATPSQIITVGVWYSLLGYWFLALLGLPWLRTLLKKTN